MGTSRRSETGVISLLRADADNHNHKHAASRSRTLKKADRNLTVRWLLPSISCTFFGDTWPHCTVLVQQIEDGDVI